MKKSHFLGVSGSFAIVYYFLKIFFNNSDTGKNCIFNESFSILYNFFYIYVKFRHRKKQTFFSREGLEIPDSWKLSISRNFYIQQMPYLYNLLHNLKT